jgi:hypothetical protein
MNIRILADVHLRSFAPQNSKGVITAGIPAGPPGAEFRRQLPRAPVPSPSFPSRSGTGRPSRPLKAPCPGPAGARQGYHSAQGERRAAAPPGGPCMFGQGPRRKRSLRVSSHAGARYRPLIWNCRYTSGNSHIKIGEYAGRPLVRAFPVCRRGILLFRARDWRGARQPQAA